MMTRKTACIAKDEQITHSIATCTLCKSMHITVKVRWMSNETVHRQFRQTFNKKTQTQSYVKINRNICMAFFNKILISLVSLHCFNRQAEPRGTAREGTPTRARIASNFDQFVGLTSCYHMH